MNEQTTKLLETLANKMGTTVEYLWSVLIKQAPIEASILLLQFSIWGILGFLLYKTHIKFSQQREKEDEHYTRSIYNKYGDTAGIPMLLGLTLWVVIAIMCFFSIEDVINGFFNPEYWALQKVLSIGKQ